MGNNLRGRYINPDFSGYITILKIIIFGTVISILNQGGVKTPRVEVSTIIGSPRPFFTRYYVSTYHIKTA